MQERQVTVDGKAHKLPDPFLVIATQNPYEHRDVFELPESQLDLFKIVLDYADAQSERPRCSTSRTRRRPGHARRGPPALGVVGLDRARRLDATALPEGRRYMVSIARQTRDLPGVELGVSSRGVMHSPAPRRQVQLERSRRGHGRGRSRDRALRPPAPAHRGRGREGRRHPGEGVSSRGRRRFALRVDQRGQVALLRRSATEETWPQLVPTERTPPRAPAARARAGARGIRARGMIGRRLRAFGGLRRASSIDAPPRWPPPSPSHEAALRPCS